MTDHRHLPAGSHLDCGGFALNSKLRPYRTGGRGQFFRLQSFIDFSLTPLSPVPVRLGRNVEFYSNPLQTSIHHHLPLYRVWHKTQLLLCRRGVSVDSRNARYLSLTCERATSQTPWGMRPVIPLLMLAQIVGVPLYPRVCTIVRVGTKVRGHTYIPPGGYLFVRTGVDNPA